MESFRCNELMSGAVGWSKKIRGKKLVLNESAGKGLILEKG